MGFSHVIFSTTICWIAFFEILRRHPLLPSWHQLCTLIAHEVSMVRLIYERVRYRLRAVIIRSSGPSHHRHRHQHQRLFTNRTPQRLTRRPATQLRGAYHHLSTRSPCKKHTFSCFLALYDTVYLTAHRLDCGRTNRQPLSMHTHLPSTVFKPHTHHSLTQSMASDGEAGRYTASTRGSTATSPHTTPRPSPLIKISPIDRVSETAEAALESLVSGTSSVNIGLCIV